MGKYKGISTEEFIKHVPTDSRKAKNKYDNLAEILENRTWVIEPTSRQDSNGYNQRLIMKSLAFIIRELKKKGE